MKWWHLILTGALSVIVVLAAFFVGRNIGRREPKEGKVETVTVIKEIMHYKPKEVASITFSRVPVPDILVANDTVIKIRVDSVEVSLPVEHKVFKDSNYVAWVSGFRPSLDSLSITSKQMTTTITQTVEKYKKRRFTLGVQVGIGAQYGLINKQWDLGPYAGVGLNINF